MVKEFLAECTELAPIGGRGKRVSKFVVTSTTSMKAAFRMWSGGAGDLTTGLKKLGYGTKSHNSVFCYCDSKMIPVLLKNERPLHRRGLASRASGSA
jgi:hypothetical protein